MTSSDSSAEFKSKMGLNGPNKYEVVLWQKLALSYHRIQRESAGLKCLQKAIQQVNQIVSQDKSNNNLSDTSEIGK
jgi:hypothetical protein